MKCSYRAIYFHCRDRERDGGERDRERDGGERDTERDDDILN